MSMPMRAFVLAALIAVPALTGAAPRIPIMLLDGESGGPWHKWQLTTPVLKKQLDETGLFQVDVVTAPPAGADFAMFKPTFSAYRAIVWNYDAPDERWPAELKTGFEQYVANGGGIVIVHAANNAFPGLDSVQRDDRCRRLAGPRREGGPALVHEGWHAVVRSLAWTRRQSRTPRALPGHHAQCHTPDRARSAEGVDAAG